jgi:DNA polymerase-4
VTVTETSGATAASGWRATQDVRHPDHGHGWVQGTGHGVVSVRFETRATGPGKTRTFRVDDPDLSPADPLASLAWEDWSAAESVAED